MGKRELISLFVPGLLLQKSDFCEFPEHTSQSTCLLLHKRHPQELMRGAKKILMSNQRDLISGHQVAQFY